jgi:acetolactate synthase-1/2/3 large subunit
LSTQGYKWPDASAPAQKIVLVHPARAAFRRVYKADLAAQGDCAAFVDAMLGEKPAAGEDRGAWICELTDYQRRFSTWTDVTAPDGIVFGAVMSALSELLPEDGIITHDAGNFSAWMHRYLRFRGRQTLIGGIGGAMGFGIPAAVAASLRHPERKAVCLVGDGGALMTGSEIATAVQYGAKPLVILANNNSYGTIRSYQQRMYPGRLIGTDLRNPDFVAYAKSFGAQAWRLDDPGKIRQALSEALAADSAALLEVTTSITHISAYASAPQ